MLKPKYGDDRAGAHPHYSPKEKVAQTQFSSGGADKYSIEGIFIEDYIRPWHGHMRELRTQQGGRPFRMLYAFDPRRNAILLIGGDKTGDNRWYEKHVPIADHLYDEHLQQLRKEGLIDE